MNTDERAFPVCNEANVNNQEGMTLRDYFAGQALIEEALIAARTVDETAAFCYRVADAMLKERAKAQEGEE